MTQKVCHDRDYCNCYFSLLSCYKYLLLELTPINTKFVIIPSFGIKTALKILKTRQKNGLKIDEFKTYHHAPAFVSASPLAFFGFAPIFFILLLHFLVLVLQILKLIM